MIFDMFDMNITHGYLWGKRLEGRYQDNPEVWFMNFAEKPWAVGLGEYRDWWHQVTDNFKGIRDYGIQINVQGFRIGEFGYPVFWESGNVVRITPGGEFLKIQPEDIEIYRRQSGFMYQINQIYRAQKESGNNV